MTIFLRAGAPRPNLSTGDGLRAPGYWLLRLIAMYVFVTYNQRDIISYFTRDFRFKGDGIPARLLNRLFYGAAGESLNPENLKV